MFCVKRNKWCACKCQLAKFCTAVISKIRESVPFTRDWGARRVQLIKRGPFRTAVFVYCKCTVVYRRTGGYERLRDSSTQQYIVLSQMIREGRNALRLSDASPPQRGPGGSNSPPELPATFSPVQTLGWLPRVGPPHVQTLHLRADRRHSCVHVSNVCVYTANREYIVYNLCIHSQYVHKIL
jgi:hypothetical protein